MEYEIHLWAVGFHPCGDPRRFFVWGLILGESYSSSGFIGVSIGYQGKGWGARRNHPKPTRYRLPFNFAL